MLGRYIQFNIYYRLYVFQYIYYISNAAGCFGHVQCGVCSIWAIEYSCRRIWRLQLRLWVSTRAPNSQRHLLRATYVAVRHPPPPHAISSLSTWTWVFRPKCSLLYNTHNYRQIEATNSLATHTNTHTYGKLARSLMQTTPPISG